MALSRERVSSLKSKIRFGAAFQSRKFSVGYGLTDVDNRYRLAVRVYDQNTEDWFRNKFRDLFAEHGEDIDIRQIGTRLTMTVAAAAPPSAAGLSIGMGVRHQRGDLGTLGFFARRNESSGFVSCNHVIAIRDRGRNGDHILNEGGNRIGELARFHQLSFFANGLFRPRADCAFASVDNGLFPQHPGHLGGEEFLSSARPTLTKEMRVQKIGRASGRTRGRITSVDFDELQANFVSLVATLDNVIEIESDEPPDENGRIKPFATDGDSGALVFTDDLRPVGMLFYATTGGSNRAGLAYANRIDLIEKALRLRMVVTP